MKKNLALKTDERWRSPLFGQMNTTVDRTIAVLRRFFDLPAGSIWTDLSEELKSVSGRLLDVGCGAQPYRALVPAGVEYIGMDMEDSREKFGYQMPNTIYYAGNTWPIESSSIDSVLCTETLEHVLEPLPFLSEAARCLRAGGRLVLTVPFSARWHFIPYDYWRFTPSALAHLLSKAGFKNICVYGRGNALTVACYKVMALVLLFLMPQQKRVVLRALFFLCGIVFVPVFIVTALVGNISLAFDGGDDCLGYSVIAERVAP